MYSNKSLRQHFARTISVPVIDLAPIKVDPLILPDFTANIACSTALARHRNKRDGASILNM
ncbi:hypothetical protein DBV39_06720 [Orrella marina]|uniref:Uncharacterized protein n=1 Tax=Orrella marina TaxID=2163011 RepID=A0A2R4XI20_9BURK|nr:hypothetical protein DBV39_06720 [Orrella marina]